MKIAIKSCLGVLAAVSLLGLRGTEALAASSSLKACVATNGKVSIKERCSTKEKLLKITNQAPVVLAGQKGETGAQGPAGERGPAGEKGLKGDKGERGDVGPQGAVGAVGPQGAVGPVGAQGIHGPQGLTGPQGIQGPRGYSAFDVMPAGAVARGVTGGEFHASSANSDWGVMTSLGGVAPVAFSNQLVVINNNTNVDNECGGGSCLSTEELTYSAHCGGTYQNPTASPGWLCIYPVAAVNASALQAYAVPSGEGRYGFHVRWTASSTGTSRFRAVWAYTAP